MELTSKAVESIFEDCLFKDGEDTSKFVKAEGITATFGFHPDRLESHKQEIIDLFNELPSNFKKGWSFLQAYEDKNGKQWTGSHSIMEQLFCLGIAIGKVESCLPRNLWNLLPGGVPYYLVK